MKLKYFIIFKYYFLEQVLQINIEKKYNYEKNLFTTS